MEYNILLKTDDESIISDALNDISNVLNKNYGEKLKVESYRCINLTVDTIIRYNDGIVLIKRKNDPYRDFWAVPGGFVEYGEKVELAAKREAKEETGLVIDNLKLIGVYSDPNRDTRGHTVTVAYVADGFGILNSGDDAKDAKVFSKIDLAKLSLAFDHNRLITDSLEYI